METNTYRNEIYLRIFLKSIEEKDKLVIYFFHIMCDIQVEIKLCFYETKRRSQLLSHVTCVKGEYIVKMKEM